MLTPDLEFGAITLLYRRSERHHEQKSGHKNKRRAEQSRALRRTSRRGASRR